MKIFSRMIETVCNINMANNMYIVNNDRYASSNEAYIAFKCIYNNKKLQRKSTKSMLGRRNVRTKRIPCVGINFNDEYKDELKTEFSGCKSVKYYIAGILGTSYCKIFGQDNFDHIKSIDDENKSERYLDWLMCADIKNTKLFGRRDNGKANINFNIKRYGREKTK